jgi:hypothetical protein
VRTVSGLVSCIAVLAEVQVLGEAPALAEVSRVVSSATLATPETIETSAIARTAPTPVEADTADLRRATQESVSGVERPERKLLVALQHTTRFAPNDSHANVSELAIPHGLTDMGNQAGIFVVAGGLFSADPAPMVLTMILALEYEPLPWIVAPFLDVGAGGYLVLGRGAGRSEAPRIEWLWASSASAGVKLCLSRFSSIPINIRVFGQGFRVEPPYVPLPVVFSGWGLGFGLEYQFGVPDVHLIRQFSHGDGMADGW